MDKEDYIQSEPLKEIVTAALDQSELYGRSEILKHITTAVNAYACVIWELAPNTTAQPDTSDGYMFVSEKWFADNQLYAFHDLPLQSVAGHTVLTQKTINVIDTQSEVRISEDPKFLQNLGIHTLLAVPIRFNDATRRGALLVYRKQPTPFSDDEIKLVQQFALLLPLVNETIRVKTIFNLMRGVDSVLSKIKLNGYVKQDSKEIKSVIYKAIEQICKLCSTTFHTVETSIFLDDRMRPSGVFDLIATTWPLDFEKTTITPHDNGLTSWVLTNKKSVRIFDLANFERDHYSIINQYPNLHWHDSLKIQDAARTALQLRPESDLPPLSFMACPIMAGEKVLGAIRCCVSKSGSYFDTEDVALLELVAAKVSQYWTEWMNELEVQEENRSWREFSVGISELNTFVLFELSHEGLESHRIFNKAMKLIESVIKGADIIGIRLLDENNAELITAAVYGDAWVQGGSNQASKLRTLRFPVNEETPLSAGAYVFKTGKVYVMADTYPHHNYSDLAIFPSTRPMIIAPIKIEDQTFGVLDIQLKNGTSISRNAATIVELIGRQLGLYHYLAVTMGRLRAAEASLMAQVKERVQALDDLTHQLRSPINQAYARIESIIRNNVDKDIPIDLLRIRGLFRKATRVTASLGLFAALAGNRQISVNLSPLHYDELIKMLIETAVDSELLIDSSRHIRVKVDRNSFEPLKRVNVLVDKNLLEQAIANILDNALKYSYPNTVINIYGGLSRSNLFFIAVTNTGLPLKRSDIANVVERGWRSAEAKWTTGEGSGIGLWIVSYIMKGHNGELQIAPTTSQHVTEIKLLFEVQREK